MRFEKTNNVEIVVKDLDSLHHSCKQFEIAIVEMQGRKNIHNMLVISLLYNMRYTLNEHFGEFYPVNNHKQSKSCLDEVSEIFRSIFEQRHQFFSINKNTDKEVHDLFVELQETLIQTLLSKSWTGEDEKRRALDRVDEIRYAVDNIDHFRKTSSTHLKSMDA
ncbi:unnamed protein product, partial [Schistosoma turkestanicum]